MLPADVASSLTRVDVEQASKRIAPYVHRTPILTSSTLDDLIGLEVHFKCENFQRSGAFKMRGAANAVLQLSKAERKTGVITHSSGNHGAALALAGSLSGVPVWVVIPENASSFKRRAIERYGATIVDCGPTLDDRETMVRQVGDETGATFVSPYNDERIVAGQGTVALELIDSVPDLDEVWVPIGGGGLASGCVVALQDSGARVCGAEPELADDAYRSLALQSIQPALPPITIADGLRTALGTITFGILNAYRMDIRLVSETDIVAAQKLVFECLKIVVEPSSAVPLAALLGRAQDRENSGANGASRVGVILTGGNLEFQSC